MIAAVYTKFSDPITIKRVPKPTTPSHNGVIIKVKATGVCRSDWHGWKGHDDDIKSHGLPFIPGHEFSGIITSVGKDVRKFLVGDYVAVPFILSCSQCRECKRGKPTVCEDQNQPGFTMWGSFAEYVCISRADWNLCHIPSGVSFMEAAALGCRFTTAYRAIIQRGRLEVGDTVAVFGVGGLGLSCIMIAAAKSHKASQIIAIDVSKQALEKALEVGATHVLNANDYNNDEEVQQAVIHLSHEKIGVNLAVDAAGFPSTCENAVYCTRRGGRMVQVGLPIGGRPPLIPMGRVAGREIDIFGSHGAAAVDMPHILQLVARNELDPKILIEKEVDLQEGVLALQDMDRISPVGMTMITSFHGNIQSHL